MLSLFSWAACTDQKPTENSPPVTTNVAADNTPTNARPTYPALPLEKAKELWEKCDYVDYVFYELAFSMSLNKGSDIKNCIRQISSAAIQPTTPVCKPIGRIFYQHDGENLAEADFYYTPANQCYYLIFLENNQPAYGNLLTVDAVNYYKQVFSTIQAQGQ